MLAVTEKGTHTHTHALTESHKKLTSVCNMQHMQHVDVLPVAPTKFYNSGSGKRGGGRYRRGGKERGKGRESTSLLT